MKKISVMLLIVLSLFVFPSFVSAYTNAKGLNITNEEYNNLRKLYTEKNIETMTTSEFNRVMSKGIDFDNIKTTRKYIRSEYNTLTGKYEDIEVTKKEYDEADPTARQNPNKSAYVDTTYKELILNMAKVSQSTAFVITTLIWKYIPATRSYDVIGERYLNASYINGTQFGKQLYETTGGTTNSIVYSYDGTNINNQTNGYGISMNLVDDPIVYLECELESDIAISRYPAIVYASYQHATSNVTLAVSKSYTIAAGGLGSVFLFSGTNGTNYDGMQGVYDGFTS